MSKRITNGGILYTELARTLPSLLTPKDVPAVVIIMYMVYIFVRVVVNLPERDCVPYVTKRTMNIRLHCR